MRVLHLIDPSSPGGGGCTLRLLAEPAVRLTSVRQDVLIIGTKAHVNLARRCGVEPCGSISPPGNRPGLARKALRRLISIYEQAGGEYDVVHGWTARSVALAMAAAPERHCIGSLAVGPISGVDSEWFSLMHQRRPVPLLAFSGAVRDEYAGVGVDPEHMLVLPPAVNPQSVDVESRDELRRRWGVDDDTVVVGLVSEPITWADARRAMAAISLATVSGRRVRLVVHPTASRRLAAEDWAASLGQHHLMIFEDDMAEPWRIVHALDVALVIGGDLNTDDLRQRGSPFAFIVGGGRRLRPMPGVMPLLWAMSAGVPVVAEAGPAVDDILTDGRTGLLVNQGDISAAADRIVRLHDDKTIAGRLGTAARQVATERFNISAFCVRLKALYEDLVGARTVHLKSPGDIPLAERRETAQAS